MALVFPAKTRRHSLKAVIPAQAGIHCLHAARFEEPDSRLRGNDE